MNIQLILFLAGVFSAISVYMFFVLQERILAFKPKHQEVAIRKTELIERLKTTFANEASQNPAFDMIEYNGHFVITWQKSIKAFQLIDVENVGSKRVFDLTFDERTHDIFLVMKDKDWDWSVGLFRADLSFEFSSGFMMEYSSKYIPSFDIRDGRVVIDLKRLKYSSKDIWLPLKEVINRAGWTIRSSSVRGKPLRLAIAACVFLSWCAFMPLIPNTPFLSSTNNAETTNTPVISHHHKMEMR